MIGIRDNRFNTNPSHTINQEEEVTAKKVPAIFVTISKIKWAGIGKE